MQLLIADSFTDSLSRLNPSFARILKKVRKFGISAIGCSVTCLLLTVVISKFNL